MSEQIHSGIDPHDFTKSEDPFALFDQWMEAARQNEPCDPNALALASVDADGLPDVRMVLLKGVDEGGFVFYTNLESGKARHFEENPKAAMCFHWKSLARQIRIRGSLERVSDAQADAYFASRGRGSRIGAWASRQSRPLESRAVLEKSVADFDSKFGEGDIPRPAHWSGFRLLPVSMEFWKNGEDRLHDRVRFLPDGKGAWQPTRLYP